MQYLKAIYAAAAAGLATSIAYAHSGHIGLLGGLEIAAAVVGSFGVVWGVPNAAPKQSPPAG